jgi:hypothetical protein
VKFPPNKIIKELMEVCVKTLEKAKGIAGAEDCN